MAKRCTLVCVNAFESSGSKPSATLLTKRWIEAINRMHRTERTVPTDRDARSS